MAGESLQDIDRRFTKRSTPPLCSPLCNYNPVLSHEDVYLPGSSESKTEGKKQEKTSRRLKFPKPTTINTERVRECYIAKQQADIL